MHIRIARPTNGAPAGKLADAELHFHDGWLSGLKLVGFAIWEGREGRRHHVTFPARQYVTNGERRHYTLLRSVDEAASADRLRERILQAFSSFQEHDDGDPERAEPSQVVDGTGVTSR